LVPRAVAIEVLGTGHLGRHVRCCGDAIVLAVGACGPVCKVVVLRLAPAVVGGIVGAFAPELGAAARGDVERAVVGLEMNVAAPRGADAAVVTAIDTEMCDTAWREAAVGRGQL